LGLAVGGAGAMVDMRAFCRFIGGKRPRLAGGRGRGLTGDLHLGGFVVSHQAFSDFVGYVGAGAHKFSAQALGRSGPDHIAILTHQPDRSDGLVLALLGAAAVVFTNAETAGAVAATARVITQTLARSGADLRARIDAVAGLEGVGENVVVTRAFEDRVGFIFIFGDHELFGIMQAGHQQVADLERSVAARQDRDVDAANLAQVLGGFFLGRRLLQEGREQ
jgi:hypothetical protein